MSPKIRVIAAGVLLGLTLIAWPLSALTWAKSEPPFVLSLSWAAIALTCVDILATADTREKQEEE